LGGGTSTRVRHNVGMAVAPVPRDAALAPAVSETAERLFREHSGWIYGYCLRLLRSPEEAEDALQATYLNACRGLSQGVRPKAHSAWLLRITQNACYSRLRASGRRARLERVHDLTLLEETVPAPARPQDELIGLTDALVSLPEQQRRAILLREWQGLSHREVAEVLGLSQGAAEALIFRARRSLAAALENEPKRSRLKAVHALDVAGLLATIKGLFAGAVGAKAAAAAVVVAAATTATVVASDPIGFRGDRPEAVASAASGGAPSRTTAPAAGSPLPVGVGATVAGGRPEEGTAVPARGPETGRARGQERAAAAKEKAGKGNANGHANGNGNANANGSANGNGNAHGQATAAAAKAKPKSNNGNANGNTNPSGGAPTTSNGTGTPAGGHPETSGQTGPPGHAPAKGHAKGKAAKPSASK
jgi:RNA polymerase sigma-70 factor, ECF subfamily